MSIILDFDEQVLASLPLQPGERERLTEAQEDLRYEGGQQNMPEKP